jgi:acyl-CoA synthetase (AMP-forming)/AMP-acid ligase II
VYTSDTTGRPKGAMLTHGNIWWNNTSGLLASDTPANDVTLTAPPIFHIGGLNVTTLVTFQKGGFIVFHRNFDPGRVLADIAEYRVTTMFGVPAMFLFMAQHLKRILKLDRLRLRGPSGAKDEFLFAATAQNLRKLPKLIPFPAPTFAS